MIEANQSNKRQTKDSGEANMLHSYYIVKPWPRLFSSELLDLRVVFFKLAFKAGLDLKYLLLYFLSLLRVYCTSGRHKERG